MRYPGGKGKLARSVAKIISDNKLVGGHYAEPYAGGAAVGLFLLFHEYVTKFHLNDLDPSVYAFWHTVLNETDWLCDRIRSTPITPAEWLVQRSIYSASAMYPTRELGFATFFLNRTNRSGIIKGGGMIGGNDQKGKWKLDVRFNRADLIDRIQEVASLGCRIVLTNLDAEKFLSEASRSLPMRSLLYLDPPYFEKGPGLYQSHYRMEDHLRIARKINQGLSHKWLVSYDAHPEIIKMYSKRRSLIYDLRYQASRTYIGREIMIFSDDLDLKVDPKLVFPVAVG